MSGIPFLKMQVLGNDFVMLDGVSRKLELDRRAVRRIADRRRGVGCDQVLMLEPPSAETDFRYRIWNSDGEEVEQCGNGARCVPEFARRAGLRMEKEDALRNPIRLETANGCLTVEEFEDGTVRADLGILQFEDATVHPGREQARSVSIRDCRLRFDAIVIGNPHAVFIADQGMVAKEFEDYDLALLAATVRSDIELFPEGVNVGLCRHRAEDGVAELRVDERGAGETPACGSGAAAAAAALTVRRGCSPPIPIELVGGKLKAGWNASDSTAWIQGEVDVAFEGVIDMGLIR